MHDARRSPRPRAIPNVIVIVVNEHTHTNAHVHT